MPTVGPRPGQNAGNLRLSDIHSVYIKLSGDAFIRTGLTLGKTVGKTLYKLESFLGREETFQGCNKGRNASDRDVH